MEKACRTCGKLYENTTENFQRNTGWKDGLHIHCKGCLNGHNRKCYAKDSTKKLARGRAWRERNLDRERAKSRERSRQYVLAGKVKERYWKNKAVLSARKKADYQKNRERFLAKQKRYYEENREKALATAHAVYRRNPDPYKARSRGRKAKLRGADGTVTAADIRRQYAAQKGLCYWCDAELGETFDLDHVMPLALEGEHSPANIVVACCHCNASKRAKHPAEFNRDRWQRFQRERGAA